MLYNLFYFVLALFASCVAIAIVNGLSYLLWKKDSNKEDFFVFLCISILFLLLMFIVDTGISSCIDMYSNTNVLVAELNTKIEILQILNENQTSNTLVANTVDLIDEYNTCYNNVINKIEEYSRAEDKNFIQDNFDLIIYDYISNKAVFDDGSPITQVEYVPPN